MQIKIANVVLHKGTHSESGREIYYLSGDTYNLHKRINLGKSGLGFQYWRQRNMWWMYKEEMTSRTISALSNNGVDVSAYSGEKQSPESGFTSKMPDKQNYTQEDNLTDKSWDFKDNYSEEKRLSDKAGFPVKKIYEQDVEIIFENQPITLRAELHRTAKKGKNVYDVSVARGWQGIPLYLVKVFLKDSNHSVGSFLLPINRDELKLRKWTTINESVEVVPLIEQKVKDIYQDPVTKGHALIKQKLLIEERDPEFVEFIKKQIDRQYEENGQIVRHIKITEPPEYAGTYPVLFATFDGHSWYGNTYIKHPLLPPDYSSMVYSLKMPYEIKTIEQFNNWLDSAMNDPENLQEAQKRYVSLLKKFPFLKETQEQYKKTLSELIQFVLSRSLDTEFFRNKLINMGYLRPRKSRTTKYDIEQITLQKDIPLVLDSEKILNDTYKIKINSPDSFYTTLAYYMHRLRQGNIGWMPMVLIDSVGKVVKTLKTYGYEVDYRELDDYLKTLARKLLREALGIKKDRGTATENWDAFYGNWNRPKTDTDTDTDETEQYQNDSILEEFAAFASSHGIDPELAKKQPKLVYRQLMLKIHPDRNLGNEEWATGQTKILNQLYDQIPDHLKETTATKNWWKSICLKFNLVKQG